MKPGIPHPGTYTITAKAYTKDNARGTKCDSRTVTITFKESRDLCKGKISDFVLFDPADFSVITTLQNGGTYCLDELPADFGIEALINGEVGSVGFDVNGDRHTENVEPYTYPANSNGTTWNPAPGTYTIKASAYSLDRLSGERCDTDEITITIEDGCKEEWYWRNYRILVS